MSRPTIPVTTSQWEKPENVHQVIQGLTQQEQTLRLSRFDASIAIQIGDIIRSRFESEFAGKSILVSIRLWSGLTLYQSALGPNVAPTNEEWVVRKTNTVRSYGKSSFLVGRELVAKGRDINSLASEFAAHGGGFPILIRDVGAIGAVIVSGLAQWQDHEMVVHAIEKVKTELGL